MRTVPNGADTRVFQPRAAAEARARLGVPDDGPVISFVGKLVPRKGVDTLIEAMGILGRRPGGAPLLVAAGIGEMREGLERRAAELGVGDRVRFVGKVAHDEVGWWMAAGDLFVLPSLSEGLPDRGLRGDELRPPGGGHGGRRHARDRPRRRDRHPGAAERRPARWPRRSRGSSTTPRSPPAMGEAALRIGRAEYTWEANARTMTGVYEELTA